MVSEVRQLADFGQERSVVGCFRSHVQGNSRASEKPSFRPTPFNCVTPASQRDPVL
jgi:hypothetical protein